MRIKRSQACSDAMEVAGFCIGTSAGIVKGMQHAVVMPSYFCSPSIRAPSIANPYSFYQRAIVLGERIGGAIGRYGTIAAAGIAAVNGQYNAAIFLAGTWSMSALAEGEAAIRRRWR